MAYKLSADYKVHVGIGFFDATGNPGAVDGIPAITSTTPDVAGVTADADGLGFLLVPVGGVGVAQVQVEADVDLGDGVEPLVGLFDCEVIGGKVVAMTFTPGTPQPK